MQIIYVASDLMNSHIFLGTNGIVSQHENLQCSYDLESIIMLVTDKEQLKLLH